ncbi:unnamed protein product, partial [marine sediment metagenome]
NITENYVTYVKEMSSKTAVYLEQTLPLIMNREQTLTTVATHADFILSNSADGIPVGMIDAEFGNLAKAFLLIIGRAVNTYDGQNNLDCTTATHNQWRYNLDGDVYWDLVNTAPREASKSDGQMRDTDWECMVQGVVHPFTLMAEIKYMTALNNRIGLRLRNARSRQNNLIVTVDVYLKVVWKL